MSLRLPQSLGGQVAGDARHDALNAEVMAEQAASLGRAGRRLEAALAAVRAGEASDVLLDTAADAAYAYLVQRELMGLFPHDAVLAELDIPRTVAARIGVRRGSP